MCKLQGFLLVTNGTMQMAEKRQRLVCYYLSILILSFPHSPTAAFLWQRNACGSTSCRSSQCQRQRRCCTRFLPVWPLSSQSWCPWAPASWRWWTTTAESTGLFTPASSRSCCSTKYHWQSPLPHLLLLLLPLMTPPVRRQTPPVN